MRISGRNELGLVRCFPAFAISIPTLPLLPLSFLFFGFPLVLEATKRLSNRCGSLTSLLIAGVVETWCWLLFEWNVCIVLHRICQYTGKQAMNGCDARPCLSSWSSNACYKYGQSLPLLRNHCMLTLYQLLSVHASSAEPPTS